MTESIVTEKKGVEEKRCPRCKGIKPAKEFGISSTRYDGLTSYCKVCLSAIAAARYQTHPEWQKRASLRRKTPEHRQKVRDERLQREFGVSPEDYERLLIQQKGVCAICRQRDKRRRLAVDHDHQTGRVRGLLCAKCNTTLGYWGESPETADRAAGYLRAHAQL